MCLLYCACYTKFIFADPLQKPHACQRFLKLLRNRHVLVTFGRVHSPLRLPHIATQNDASTSKMAVVCFVHVDFETRFPPQRRALVRQLNFQGLSETNCFYTFHFDMCFRATSAGTFRHLNFQKCSEGSAPAALASLIPSP